MSSPNTSTPITISSLTHLSPTTLAPLLLDPAEQPKIAIIDVRDSDHIGGHIKGSTWIPVNQLEARIPELLRVHADKNKIVFHCMLSQQRGPSAALKFARAARAKGGGEEAGAWSGSGGGGEKSGSKGGPEVCVLAGGFGAWQARYGEDSRLTEGYVPDIWDE